MYMAEIKNFVSEMRLYNLEFVSCRESCLKFSQVLPLSSCGGAAGDFQRECLYVGSCSQAAAMKTKAEDGLFLLMEDASPIPGWLKDDNTVIVSKYVQSPDLLFFQARQWLSEYTAYLESSNILSQVFFSPKGSLLPRLMDTGAKLLGNPMILLDANFRILTGSSSYPAEDPVWQQNLSRGYCSYEQNMELKGFLENGCGQQDDGERDIFSSAFSSSRICVKSLNMHREHMGSLLIFESCTPFSKMNRRLLSFLASLACSAVYSSYERDKTLNEFDEDYIFIECLSGKLRSYGNYLDRIKNTPFAAPASYHVILIDVTHFEHFDPKKEILRNYFSRIFKRSWMLWFRGNVVAIVDIAGFKGLPEALEKGNDFFRSKCLRMAASDCFTNIYYIEKYYRQAMVTERFSALMHPESMFSYYNEYKFFDLLASVSPDLDLTQYVDSRIIHIAKYDEKNRAEYGETLRVFLSCGQNLARTSSALHIHKNTVSYRISRAKELFSLDLSDAEECFRLACSYKILEILKLTPEHGDRAVPGKTPLHPYTMLC